MKKLCLFLCFFAFWQVTEAQQKYALVIGNGNYTALGRLRNPVNDAEDVAAALNDLGFSVDKVLDGDLDRMENAVLRLRNRLSAAKNSYGFLFYAGHGVQSNGVNYLIPIGANIPSEGSLRERSVSVQWMLGELNDAGNELNVVVLDACRDNPFFWGRSGSRGLTVIGNQPADSIVVYATSAGSVAQDGTGRNGLFTSYLLKNLKTPGLEIKEIFNRTGIDVIQASGRKQIPAVYVQFFGNAYFSKPALPTATSTIISSTPPPAVAAPVPAPAAVAPIPQPEPPKAATVPVQPPVTPPETPETVAAQANQLVEMPEIVIAPGKPAITPQPAKTKPATTNSAAYSFMNLAFGLGSYLQGDVAGGVIITGGYAAAIGLLAWELSMSLYDKGSGVPGNIGIAAGIGTLVFSFVKPYLFEKKHRLASAIDNFDIALVSSERSKSAGTSAVAIKYTYNF